MTLIAITEQYPRRWSRVEVASEDATRPAVSHAGPGPEVALAGDTLRSELPRLFAKLPIEDVRIASEFKKTEAHALGTVVMGNDPATSVVDRHLVHHHVRNLLVLGGSAFPTASPANPTLTISALSLWAAEHQLS